MNAPIQRYRSAIGGNEAVWPITVPDVEGPLVYLSDHRKIVAALKAQIQQLREALDIISNHGVQYPWTECARIARAALAATEPK